jgi:NAD(P)-dependent dehydrogenase (short-subunit alcohol dehydrogenase family)
VEPDESPIPGRELAGRVAIVTGAGSGIGRATALRFAAAGARIAVNDIDGSSAERTAHDVEVRGGRALAHHGDVSDSAYVDTLVADTVARLGRLDVMHNNAGYGLPGAVVDTTDAALDEVLRVNFLAVVFGTRAALRVMIEQRSGVIVNTASNAGFGAARDRATYGAAKAAVINLTRSTAAENGRFGIRANAICPGPIETPAFVRFAPDIDFYRAQIPMRRLGTAEEVAELALFLVSDRSSYISGTAISIDGAMMATLPAPYLGLDDVAGA